MLVRTVRMTFDPAHVPDFLALFEAAAPRIRAVAGCAHLELWQDAAHPNILQTYSLWTGPEALEAYRRSTLFAETWARTKPFFAAPPVAHSYAQRAA